jgi:hypothetical protein
MAITYKNAQKTLRGLKQFYANEQNGLPHEDAALFDLAWDLAEWLEDAEYNGGRSGMAEFAVELRKEATAVNVDTAVNWLHQSILDYGRCTDEEYDAFLSGAGFGGDIVEFLVNRV